MFMVNTSQDSICPFKTTWKDAEGEDDMDADAGFREVEGGGACCWLLGVLGCM